MTTAPATEKIEVGQRYRNVNSGTVVEIIGVGNTKALVRCVRVARVSIAVVGKEWTLTPALISLHWSLIPDLSDLPEPRYSFLWDNGQVSSDRLLFGDARFDAQRRQADVRQDIFVKWTPSFIDPQGRDLHGDVE